MALQDGSVRISSEPECNAVMDMSLLTQNICTCVAIMKRLVCLKCGVLSNSVTEPSPMTWSFLSKVLETERKFRFWKQNVSLFLFLAPCVCVVLEDAPQGQIKAIKSNIICHFVQLI